MKLIVVLFALSVVATLGISSCSPKTTPSTNSSNSTPKPVTKNTPGPLPVHGFKAQITPAESSLKLRAGQQQTISIKVKNISDVIWWARGGETNDRTDNMFYVAAGNRWLDKEGKLTHETEGHNGIPKDLKPGEELEMTLDVIAPKTPGEWTMSLDLVQEGVTWFSEKGSSDSKVKVTVVK
jgi:hypothetical protein